MILNRVAGKRHETILRQSIEHYCGIPVIGAIPKLTADDFPERHMGLVPTPEHNWAKEAIGAAARIAADFIDLEAVMKIAARAGDRIVTDYKAPQAASVHIGSDHPKIAIARDSAFQFYYPDNLEALENAGADLVFTSPVNDAYLPEDIDGLYLGGGFPETHARQLAENISFRRQVAERAGNGLPVYAECGGLIYLGKEIIMDEAAYPMCGIFPVSFGISKRPVGHGYTISLVDRENPYFEIGTELKGHEFRYSRILTWEGNEEDLVFSTVRGKGFESKRDGLCRHNVLATYTHLHALGTPSWAPAMVRTALVYHQTKKAG